MSTEHKKKTHPRRRRPTVARHAARRLRDAIAMAARTGDEGDGACARVIVTSGTGSFAGIGNAGAAAVEKTQ